MAALVSDLDQKVGGFSAGIELVQEALQIERERQSVRSRRFRRRRKRGSEPIKKSEWRVWRT